MSIGLVIQGPIVSHGLTGATVGFGKTRIKKERIVEFNCQENIIDMAIAARQYFDMVVVSTWKDLDYSYKAQLHEFSVEYTESQDPLDGKKSPKKGDISFQDNQTRQFLSTLQGLKKLDIAGVDFAVKIRTDQAIDLKELRACFERFIKSKNEFFIPFLRTDIPTIIPDFYLGASVTNLQTLCHMLISPHYRFHRNVHRDIFWKAMLLAKEPSSQINPFQVVFGGNGYDEWVEEFMQRNLKSVFYPGSKELFSSLIWRGENIKSNSENFNFEGQEFVLTKSNLIEPVRFDFGLVAKNVIGKEKILMFAFILLSWRVKEYIRKTRITLSYFKNRRKFRV